MLFHRVNGKCQMNQSFQVDTAEAPFLRELFKTLNNRQVKYCVLRNYETLPYSLDGSDLDILVTSLKDLSKKGRKALVLTGCSIEESANKALGTITSKMAARYEKK